MRRERALKVILVLVGLLFSAGIYPLTASLWHANKSVRSKLLTVAHRIREPKGSVLFHRNDSASGVFLVRTGRVALKLDVGQHGVAVVNRTVARDSILGLPGVLSNGQYSLTAVAVEDSEVAFVDRAALLELIRGDSNDVGLEIIRLLGEEVVRIREVLASSPVH